MVENTTMKNSNDSVKLSTQPLAEIFPNKLRDEVPSGISMFLVDILNFLYKVLVLKFMLVDTEPLKRKFRKWERNKVINLVLSKKTVANV